MKEGIGGNDMVGVIPTQSNQRPVIAEVSGSSPLPPTVVDKR